MIYVYLVYGYVYMVHNLSSCHITYVYMVLYILYMVYVYVCIYGVCICSHVCVRVSARNLCGSSYLKVSFVSKKFWKRKTCRASDVFDHITTPAENKTSGIVH